MEADYPHTTADEGEHNHQGEKKSMMRKVKDKAKKIKETIKKYVEDEEVEETVNGSDVHGAPGFVSGTNLPKQTGLDLGKPAVPPKEVYPIVGEATETTGVHDDGDTGGLAEGKSDRSLRNEVHGSKNSGVRERRDSNGSDEFRPEDRTPDLQDNSHTRDEVIRTSGPGKFDDPQVQHHSPDSMELEEESAVKSGPLEDLVEDPNRPGNIHPSNYQSKAVDPTNQGGKEADVSPLVQGLDNLHVGDEQSPRTGSRDQFAPEFNPDSNNEQSPHTGSRHQFAPEFNPDSNNDQFEFNPARPESMPRDTRPESMPRGTIAGKISLATSAVTGTAVSAKNAVASKLGYGDTGVAAVDGGGGESDKGAHRPGDNSPSNYQSKAVDSTNQGGKEASDPEFNPDAIPLSKNPKTLDPARPEPTPRGTIAGKISSATSAVGGTAVSAKNAVASKLGYGDSGVAAVDGGGGESDKGGSVKESWSEKLKPGEEDRALSEAFTDAIHKRKGNKSEEEEEISENPGVVGRVKGAVTSWLGMSGGTPTVDQDRQGVGAGEGGLDNDDKQK
ncbi:hypothetical protein ACS0TY_004494 [Phlomoides rotata]